MIGQFGRFVIHLGFEVKVLEFRDKDAARAWTYGAGVPRVSKNFIVKQGSLVAPALAKIGYEPPKPRRNR